MKRYNVKITSDAKRDMDRILAYLSDVLRNGQAVRNVWQDYLDTREALSRTAGLKPDPDSPALRARGLKRIEFRRHDYFLLFKIVGDDVFITNVFHTLEDFERKLR